MYIINKRMKKGGVHVLERRGIQGGKRKEERRRVREEWMGIGDRKDRRRRRKTISLQESIH